MDNSDERIQLVRKVVIWYTVDRADYLGMSDEAILRYETDEVDTVDILRQSDAVEITTILDETNIPEGLTNPDMSRILAEARAIQI